MEGCILRAGCTDSAAGCTGFDGIGCYFGGYVHGIHRRYSSGSHQILQNDVSFLGDVADRRNDSHQGSRQSRPGLHHRTEPRTRNCIQFHPAGGP